jgi:hypothetical protein
LRVPLGISMKTSNSIRQILSRFDPTE